MENFRFTPFNGITLLVMALTIVLVWRRYGVAWDWYCGERSGGQLFVLLQHFDESLNSFRARFRLLGGLNSKKDGVSILAIEGSVKGLGPRISIQRRL